MFFSELFSKYITNSITARETNKKLKVDLNLKAITEYSENDKDIAMQLTWFGHAACLLQSIYGYNKIIIKNIIIIIIYIYIYIFS